MCFTRRLKKLRDDIQLRGIDAILISDKANRRYFSGFTGSAGYLLVTPATAILATDSRYTEQAQDEALGWNILKLSASQEWLTNTLSDFKAKNLAIEADNITVSNMKKICKTFESSTLPLEVIPTTNIGINHRAIKDEEDLHSLIRAIQISDEAFNEVADEIEPGQTEVEIAWRFKQAVHDRGAEDTSFDTIVAAGANASRPHHRAGNKRVEKGETIVFDCGARFQGYCSDLTRTLILGEAGEKEKTIHRIVQDAQQAAIDGIKAGMTGCEADSIARSVITEAGYGENFGHSLGHGIGLEVHEAPAISFNNNDKLQDKMVFTLEPGIYIPGWGGVRIEDVVILEGEHCKVISKASRRMLQ